MKEIPTHMDFIPLKDKTETFPESYENLSPYRQFCCDLANLGIPVIIIFGILYLVLSNL